MTDFSVSDLRRACYGYDLFPRFGPSPCVDMTFPPYLVGRGYDLHLEVDTTLSP